MSLALLEMQVAGAKFSKTLHLFFAFLAKPETRKLAEGSGKKRDFWKFPNSFDWENAKAFFFDKSFSKKM